MDTDTEGKWPKGKEAGKGRGAEGGRVSASRCVTTCSLRPLLSAPVGGLPVKSQCQAVSSKLAMSGDTCESREITGFEESQWNLMELFSSFLLNLSRLN